MIAASSDSQLALTSLTEKMTVMVAISAVIATPSKLTVILVRAGDSLDFKIGHGTSPCWEYPHAVSTKDRMRSFRHGARDHGADDFFLCRCGVSLNCTAPHLSHETTRPFRSKLRALV
jgi:hypothetical protein